MIEKDQTKNALKEQVIGQTPHSRVRRQTIREVIMDASSDYLGASSDYLDLRATGNNYFLLMGGG